MSAGLLVAACGSSGDSTSTTGTGGASPSSTS